jgi:hypothetical protein
MKKEMSAGKKSGKALVVLLVGSAVVAGAALLMSKVCKKGSKAQRIDGAGSEGSGTYCSVPEGADICFPEQ